MRDFLRARLSRLVRESESAAKALAAGIICHLIAILVIEHFLLH